MTRNRVELLMHEVMKAVYDESKEYGMSVSVTQALVQAAKTPFRSALTQADDTELHTRAERLEAALRQIVGLSTRGGQGTIEGIARAALEGSDG
jgi:hypothetical protein